VKVGPQTRKPTCKPWALLTVAGTRGVTVTTAGGSATRHRSLQVHQGLAGLTRHICYVPGRLTECRRIGGDARAWEASVWRDRAVSMTHTPTGVVVRSLRGALDGDPEPAESLEVFRDWLEGFEVGLSGISGMARNLWRRSLSTTHDLDTDPTDALPALFGGRQGIRDPRTYRHQVLLDLEAAYPSEMAARPYALSWRNVSRETILDPDRAGLVDCSVFIPPGLAYGLLPERFPGDDTLVGYRRAQMIRGVWTWREVTSAIACGAELVRVHACHAPATEADLFGQWWPLVATGRQLPRGAGRLVKAVTNALWGIFAVRGTTSVMRWTDAAGNEPPISTPGRQVPNPYVRTTHLAVETTSRVRCRLLTDVLADPHLPPPVHVDTDGVILRRRADVAHLLGTGGPGTWRIKRRMPEVDIHAAQVYRYLCDDPECGHLTGTPEQRLRAALAPIRPPVWHYSVSGVPAGLAQRIFERTSRHRYDVSLPPGWQDSKPDLTTDEIWSPSP
jgi:hypothetical protein